MDVKPGYKLTDVGMIPEDWEAVFLDCVAKRGSGHTPDKKRREYWGGEIKWISLQDTDRLDRLYIYDTAAKITPAGIANSSAIIHLAGTVVLSRDAGVGKSAIMKDDMAVSQHFMAWKCSPVLNNHFLYYWLQANKSEFERIAMGNTIKTIGLPYFKQLVCPLPPLTEQEAIVEALSDADALIKSLEQLIAKKRHLKQGAMQALLTGKTRLPGFHGEWQVGIMSDHFILVGTRNEELSDNVLTMSAQQGLVRQEDFFQKRVASNVLANYFLLHRGQFAYNRSYSNGYPCGAIKRLNKYEKGVVTTLYICFQPRPYSPVCSSFFEQYFECGLLNTGLSSVVNEGGRAHGLLNVTKADFFSRPLQVPSFFEQTAIASVLSDMDAEIAALEARLDKARQIKQGMMHNLLTGKIRLA